MLDPDFSSKALIDERPGVLRCRWHVAIDDRLCILDFGERRKRHCSSICDAIQWRFIEWTSMMRKTAIGITGGALGMCFSAFAILAGCHSTQALTAQEAEGKHLYLVRCAHCHQDNDLDLKKVPPDLHGVFAHPTLPSGAPASDLEVRKVVLSGKGMMPSFAGRFTDEQMAALLAYLHTGLR
jgi:mono/diheme cytochrome c family protein